MPKTIFADSGSYKKPDDWIRWHNDNGKIMASATDIYNMGKNYPAEDLADFREKLKSLPDTLPPDWRLKGISPLLVLTSTRIIYSKNNLVGDVVHYFNSSFIAPVRFPEIIMPVYNNNESMEHILKQESGLFLVKALFNTKDDCETITKALENLSCKRINEIRLYTPDQSRREFYGYGTVGFYSDFDISGLSDTNDNLGSRLAGRAISLEKAM